MKIDKIVFSSSEMFSPWWNIQAPIWKSMGIEPVCILWGKIENTNMNPDLGEIIEKEFNPDLYESFQITWSKFYHTCTEPETTWIIGDMDLVPLQSKYFTEGISTLPDECYTHLAFGEIPRIGSAPFLEIMRRHHQPVTAESFTDLTYLNMFERLGGYYDGGMDLPAYYHVAKGKTFSAALGLEEKSFNDQVKWVCESKKFGLGPLHDNCFHQPSWSSVKHNYSSIPIPAEELYVWVADEGYSSHRIFSAHKEGKITFIPHRTPMMTPAFVHVEGTHLRHPNGEVLFNYTPPTTPNRLDRTFISRNPDGDVGSYIRPDLEGFTLRTSLGADFVLDLSSTYNNYLDVHCFRPFEYQEKALRLLLSEFWPNVHV